MILDIKMIFIVTVIISGLSLINTQVGGYTSRFTTRLVVSVRDLISKSLRKLASILEPLCQDLTEVGKADICKE